MLRQSVYSRYVWVIMGVSIEGEQKSASADKAGREKVI